MPTGSTSVTRSSSRTQRKQIQKAVSGKPRQGRTSRRSRVPWDSYPHEKLWVSCVSEQAYCEKRVELWLKEPGDLVSVPRRLEQIDAGAIVQSRFASDGTKGHSELSADALPVPAEVIQAQLALGQSFWLAESPFEGAFRGYPLAGVPDRIFFREGRAVSIVEYKFTDSNQLQTSHRVQLLLYGYLLEECGIDVSELILICALIPRRHANERLPDGIADQIRDASAQLVSRQRSLKNWRWLDMPVGNDISVNLRAFRYDRARAESELEFFTQFWSGARPAIPTRMEKKCARCLYNSMQCCSQALVRYGQDTGA